MKVWKVVLTAPVNMYYNVSNQILSVGLNSITALVCRKSLKEGLLMVKKVRLEGLESCDDCTNKYVLEHIKSKILALV